jgi:hypothetical protein
MGFLVGATPDVDPKTFMDKPYLERTQVLSRFWIENGFGSPKAIMVMYLTKLAVFFGIGGIVVATVTSHMSPLHPHQWFDQPIFYEKAILWTLLLETLGIAGSWGPLAGHMWPFTGGWHYYARLGALRNPPWPDKVPGTKGDGRTVVDVALYLAVLASLIVGICLTGVDVHGVGAHVRDSRGLVPPLSLGITLGLYLLLGLRDKIVFLAARSEQYLPAVLFMTFFQFTDMIVAAKVLIVIVWLGAGFSKLTRHFPLVLPPMVANTPWLPFKHIKRLHVQQFPEDLRASKFTVAFAHGPGVFGELVPPLVLIFSHNHTVTLCAVIFMIGYHLFIISTFPLAVPLEWNLVFMYLVAFLFLGYPNQGGYGLGEGSAAVLIPTAAVIVFFPILGNLRPDLVSFLPSFRQYAGNWASAMWAFAPGAEEKLDEHIKKGAQIQLKQLQTPMPLLGYTPEDAEITLQILLAWRSLHSQGRGLNSVMINNLGSDIDHYTLREAEFSCNMLTGFNFGEGHFHDQHLIEALQKRCQFEPGEFVVVWVESEPVWHGYQEYWVMDAAVGVVERGRWQVKDCVETKNWLPDGPIPTQVEYRMEGYERVRHPGSAVAAAVAAGSDLTTDAPMLSPAPARATTKA